MDPIFAEQLQKTVITSPATFLNQTIKEKKDDMSTLASQGIYDMNLVLMNMSMCSLMTQYLKTLPKSSRGNFYIKRWSEKEYDRNLEYCGQTEYCQLNYKVVHITEKN
ncbi:MAG: hypothetical protein Barrevirus43_3 [Barrevirus sp.]|uniref:Uncharacterized protein n=1 Tax=Barrevirus sp. TaxID=2487763 RepID=A0A3G4ZR30_9VIRU|nr:MAG: hypothetical protein Barrevirus43_3 [Barrevirus sp.]